jgi:peptidoglycan/LPS O-acetylase OafA/YrhL
LPAAAAAIAVSYAIAHLAIARGWLGLPDSHGRIGCIDGLRGYLAIGVAIQHFTIWGGVLSGRAWEAPPSLIFSNLGQAAVTLFFMITGALFYAKLMPRRATTPVDWVALYVSRVFRLLPMYWFAVGLVITIALARRHGVIGDPAKFVKALLEWAAVITQPDIAGYHPTGQIIAYVPWTLKLEWKFYASLPLLAYALSRAIRHEFATAIVPAALLICAAVDAIVFDKPYLMFVASFALGMLAVEAARRPRWAAWLQSPVAAVAGLLALSAEFVLCQSAFSIAANVLLAAFFAPVVSGNSYFGALAKPASVALGEISYSIYLLHGIVLSLFMVEGFTAAGWPASPLMWLALPFLVSVIVLLAIATFNAIEKPAINYGKSVGRRLQAARPTVSSVSKSEQF